MKFLTPILLSLSLLAPLQAQSAEEIMQSVRQVAALQEEQDLSGNIRKGRTRIPLTMFLRGKDIQFALNGGTDRFHLELKEDQQELKTIIDGKVRRFPANKIGQSIGGTDVSYEDLALKFLYWPNPTIVGEEKIEGQHCWRLHVANPEKNGRYREVSVWVTKKQRALMRVVGYGPQPARSALKQFEITDLMRVNKVYTVKTMKVSTFKPNGRVAGATYIEFQKPRRR